MSVSDPSQLFLFLVFWNTAVDPTNKPLGKPKSNSVAEGQQGFHRHSSGFEPRTSLEVPGSQTRGYTTESSPSGRSVTLLRNRSNNSDLLADTRWPSNTLGNFSPRSMSSCWDWEHIRNIFQQQAPIFFCDKAHVTIMVVGDGLNP